MMKKGAIFPLVAIAFIFGYGGPGPVVDAAQGDLLWAKRAGGVEWDDGLGIAAYSDGSCVVTGRMKDAATFGKGETNETTLTSSGYWDIFVAKYNADGTVAWAKRAGGANLDYGRSIASYPDGTCVVTGHFRDKATFGKGETNEIVLSGAGCADCMDIFVAKYNANGTLAWAKRAGGKDYDEGNAVASYSNGSCVVTGNFEGKATFGKGEVNETTLISSGPEDAFIARYNANGTLAWARCAGGAKYDAGMGITSFFDGSCVVAGWFEDKATFSQIILTSSGKNDIFVAKYSAGGKVVWAKRAGGKDLDWAESIASYSDGSCAVTGGFQDKTKFENISLTSAGSHDVFVAKYNASGKVAWAKRAGGKGFDRDGSITSYSDGSCVVTGAFRDTATLGKITLTSAGRDDIFIAKYDATGAVAWAKRAGGKEADFGHGIASYSNGACVVTGSFYDEALFGPGETNNTTLRSLSWGNGDIFVAKFQGIPTPTPTPTATPTPTPDPRGAWPMFHRLEQNTGSTHYEGLAVPSQNKGNIRVGGSFWHGWIGYSSSVPEMKWTFTTGGSVMSSPVIGAGGKVYVGSNDNRVYCLRSDGSKAWQYATGNNVTSSPLVEGKGEVYIGSWDTHIYKLNPDGSIAWKYKTGDRVESSPVPGSGGAVICVGSHDRNLYCLKADGTLVWSFKTGGKVASSPAVGADGKVYIGSHDKRLYCLKPNGSLNWKLSTGGAIASSPSVGRDGRVCVGSLDNRLYCVESNGTLAWSHWTGGGIDSSPAIGREGKVCVQSHDRNLYCLDSGGGLLWTYVTGALTMKSSPAVDGTGRVYAGSDDNRLYALSPKEGFDYTKMQTTRLSWTYRTGGDVQSSPAIGSDGTIAVGSGDGKVYAFGPGLAWEVKLRLLYDPPLIRFLVPAATLVLPPYGDLAAHRHLLHEALEHSDDEREWETLERMLGLTEEAMEVARTLEAGETELADELTHRLEVRLLDEKLGALDEELRQTENDGSRDEIFREREIFQRGLEMVEAEHAGDHEWAEELKRQVRTVAIESYLGRLDENREMAEKPEKRERIELEAELLHAELELMDAERAGDWDRVGEIGFRVAEMEERWLEMGG